MDVHVDVLPSDRSHIETFIAWVAASLPTSSLVLEVGAGEAKRGYVQQVRDKTPYLVGVDPSPTIQNNPYLDERHQMDLVAFAEQEERQFDVIFTKMVLEHVEYPDEFLQSIWKLLKPGGLFLSITPNLCHYFGLTTSLTESLGIQEFLLRLLRGGSIVDNYHFRTFYQMNTIRKLSRLLQLVGASRIEFKMIDSPRVFLPYFPKFLSFIPYVYSSLVYKFGISSCMGTIMFCALKPETMVQPA
jgi:SAM-dependent methyltransferase